MEKELLQVGQHFTTNGGTEVICFEVTEKFAFMAPVEVTETELILNVEKTLVYNIEVVEEELSPIQSIAFNRGDVEEKAE